MWKWNLTFVLWLRQWDLNLVPMLKGTCSLERNTQAMQSITVNRIHNSGEVFCYAPISLHRWNLQRERQKEKVHLLQRVPIWHLPEAYISKSPITSYSLHPQLWFWQLTLQLYLELMLETPLFNLPKLEIFARHKMCNYWWLIILCISTDKCKPHKKRNNIVLNPLSFNCPFN